MTRTGADETPERRSSERTHKILPCIVRIGDRYTEATILNLSPDGAMIDGIGGVQMGQSVQVQFGTLGWVAAKVAWAIEPRCGIAFLSPIDLEEVATAPEQS